MEAALHWINQNRTTLVIIAVLILAFFALRTKPSGYNFATIQAGTSDGQPAVLNFYSNT